MSLPVTWSILNEHCMQDAFDLIFSNFNFPISVRIAPKILVLLDAFLSVLIDAHGCESSPSASLKCLLRHTDKGGRQLTPYVITLGSIVAKSRA